MKKFLSVLLTSALFLALPLFGQDCEIYDDYKEGTSTKMVHYDTKDKPTGYTVTTVKEKQNTAIGSSVEFHQMYSDYDEYSFESEFVATCENGVVTVDMGNLVDPNTMTAYEGMEYEVTADNLSIPKNASPGDVLDDGAVSVTIDTGTPLKVTVSVTLTNRIVESKEKVETPAGTFDCLKIKYDMLTAIGFIKIKSSSAEYYNKKHGVIKSESFNKKGKLTGYSVVEEINN